jgi:chromatin structure-remodeling complex subunit RSC1/2
LGPDRSIITAAGGIAAIGGPSQVEKLPADTAKLFDRDPTTNEVLWFAAPPMNMSRARGPRYSLEYLTFIASKKRKRREASTDVDGREELGEEGSSEKRPRVGFPPTVTETMMELWKEMWGDGFTM